MRVEAFENRPVRQPDPRGVRVALKMLLLALVLVAPFLVYAGLTARCYQAEYRLAELIERRKQLSRQRERLELQRASLLSPASVDAAAREHLGMVEETPEDLVAGGARPEEAP